MKNKLSDLNDHLFMQLERLSDETLDNDKIEQEAKRSEAMVSVADQILRVASIQLQAAKIAHESGVSPVPYLPVPSSDSSVTPLPAPATPQVSTPASAPRKLAPFPPFKAAAG